ncbi:hypothetical protein DPMN_074340 [Dreissena polymorpha]|uniref:Uncharacterized protein n=1 Tax=Dreissena polymorpha TaxID=45954 RepID=A0A9D3YHI5_DREPO|nr:hypothetical protein DPMN_074340 [Dreissena polymorpha]
MKNARDRSESVIHLEFILRLGSWGWQLNGTSRGRQLEGNADLAQQNVVFNTSWMASLMVGSRATGVYP